MKKSQVMPLVMSAVFAFSSFAHAQSNNIDELLQKSDANNSALVGDLNKQIDETVAALANLNQQLDAASMTCEKAVHSPARVAFVVSTIVTATAAITLASGKASDAAIVASSFGVIFGTLATATSAVGSLLDCGDVAQLKHQILLSQDEIAAAQKRLSNIQQ